MATRKDNQGLIMEVIINLDKLISSSNNTQVKEEISEIKSLFESVSSTNSYNSSILSTIWDSLKKVHEAVKSDPYQHNTLLVVIIKMRDFFYTFQGLVDKWQPKSKIIDLAKSREKEMNISILERNDIYLSKCADQIIQFLNEESPDNVLEGYMGIITDLTNDNNRMHSKMDSLGSNHQDAITLADIIKTSEDLKGIIQEIINGSNIIDDCFSDDMEKAVTRKLNENTQSRIEK